MFKDKQVGSLAGGSDVTQYMKATHVSSWIVLAFVVIAVSLVLAWALLGTITITSSILGVKEGGQVKAFTSVSAGVYAGLEIGQAVEYQGEEVGRVTQGFPAILTPEAVRANVGDDEIFEALEPGLGSKGNLMGLVEIDPDCAPDGVISLDVVLAKIAPIQIFFQ